MSGTSGDGVDAALIRTDGESVVDFVQAVTLPYDDQFRRRLLEAAQNDLPILHLLALERELTELHVKSCQALLANVQDSGVNVQLIGFHGHTLRHSAEQRLTLQIGDASWLSVQLDCPVVSDFRRRDIAAGGQGAPLAPLYHRQVCSHQRKPLLVINLGGVANVTWIGRDGGLVAGDVGPGCGQLDYWAQRLFDVSFDRDGLLATEGDVHDGIVASVLEDPFFQLSLPKSVDRFDFHFESVGQLPAKDCLATLCAITTGAIVNSVQNLPSVPVQTLVTGGGARHRLLMSMLASKLENVNSIEAIGMRADSHEAECFAWLAVRRLRGLPTSLPTTTGCSHPVSGGLLTGM